ncbi:hypothetical protein [Chryseobacterium tongliaoense]|uniref:hypothetical protein n=1 Tax=Chryseobacterium tongliaoense TaxID=3240933 RepID=UPI00351507A5
MPSQYSEYTLLYIPYGSGIYHADFGTFNYSGPVILFSTPLQVIYLEQVKSTPLTVLQFHGDFYCIEYHRSEVACNGLLFNNIYIQPCITLTENEVHMFSNLLNEISAEFIYKR